MKKAVERIAIVLYCIGLVALPIYNVFIKEQVQIDGFVSLCGLLFSFLLYLVGWWFIWTPISLFVASLFFPDDIGKDARESCLAYIAICVMPALLVLAFKACNDDDDKVDNGETKNKFELYSTKPQKDEDVVYVCSGPYSKRYHKDLNCAGLNNCSGYVDKIDEEDAEREGYTPCRLCYD